MQEPAVQPPSTERNQKPELLETDRRHDPERVMAESIVRQRYTNMHKPLFVRAKVLVLISAVSLIFALKTCWTLFPDLYSNTGGGSALDNTIASFTVFMQASTVGYFLLAKDPAFARLVIKLLLFLYAIEVTLAIYVYGSLLFTLGFMVLLFFAHTRMSMLDFGGD